MKLAFTTSLVLSYPDMVQVFVVEADASSMAIRAVLSQRYGPEQMLHPITCYSRKLTPAEQKYEILAKELLAIKTAFGEW